MRIFVMLSFLISSPVMAGVLCDYDADRGKARIQEKIDLMKSANDLATYNVQLENETQKKLND